MRKLVFGVVAVAGIVGGAEVCLAQVLIRPQQPAVSPPTSGSFWEGGVERRPWGGPTTGPNWWTPQRGTAGQQVRIVYVPGHFEWYYGRRIWVPGRYVAMPVYTFQGVVPR